MAAQKRGGKVPSAAKRTQPKAPPRKPELGPDEPGPALRATGTPGVFVNRIGNLVDENGVLLSLKQLKQRDDERFEAVLGDAIDSPVKFMKAVVLDPRTPLPTRLEAAKAVAPYTDRKMPTAIEGSLPGSPVAVNILSGLNTSALSTKERTALMEMLRKMAESAPDDTQT